MFRKTIFAVATVATIAAAALAPATAFAKPGKGGNWGHGHFGRGFGGIVVLDGGCWTWYRGARVYTLGSSNCIMRSSRRGLRQ